jgi:hypothetical protein
MIAAGRTSKILSRFPAFMLAPSPDKALASIAAALGADVDEGERLATGIQRAHRIEVADEARDVLALGALLTLHPADFFILSGLYAGGVFASYDDYVNALRDGVRRAVAVLMDGCGTISALLEGTAILLDAARTGELEHLDDFVHRVAVHHHAGDGSIYLVENPLSEHDGGDVARRCREYLRVTRGGFFAGPVTIQVTGVGDRTVRPMVINLTTHEGVGFNGVVPDGSVLVFTTEGTALLDGADVSAQAFHFTGALFDYGGDGLIVVAPGVTQLPLGDSDWRFSVKEGAFDAADFDGCVFALPADTTGQAPSGRLKLSWQENEPFAATVLIPAELQTLQPLVDGDLPSLVRAGLERFRTAGVRLDVRYFDAEWVLDHSVLEDLNAPHGLGVDFDATIPGDSP